MRNRIDRRGVSFLVTLGALAVVTVFSISMHWLALESTKRARRFVDVRASEMIARSAISCAVSQIEQALLDDKSEIYGIFIKEDVSTGTVIPIDPTDIQPIAERFPRGDYSVAARIVLLEPLDSEKLASSTGGADPCERRFVIEIQAYGTSGGVNTNLVEQREVKVVNLSPGILGKFTLFVKNAEPGLAYNKFAADLFGKADERVVGAKYYPIVLNNGSMLDEGDENPDSFKARGYVWLGQSEVLLNLTSGGVLTTYGENFQFSKIKTSFNFPGYYHPTPPAFFAESPDDFPNKRHPQTLNAESFFHSSFSYTIKHVISGFYTIDPVGKNMNDMGKLNVTFPGTPSPDVPDSRMFSSILHLFGSSAIPSPTLVMGNVKRRYADCGAVLVECNNTDRHDALYFIPESANGLAQAGSVPAEISALEKGDIPLGSKVKLDQTALAFTNTIPSDGDYNAAMCQIKQSEPYMRSHDFMYYQGEEDFEPAGSNFSTGDFSYVESAKAHEQYTCTVDFHKDLDYSKPFFDQGDFSKLPVDYLKSKAVYRVSTAEEFMERFYLKKQNRLKLNSAVIISGDPDKTFELPLAAILEKGGIIILEEGNIRVRKINMNLDPDEVLTYVALNGDIEIDLSQGHPIKANLIALNGKLRNSVTPNLAFDLEGTLAVGKLLPDTFPEGGRIAYDSRVDPSDNLYPTFYRAYLSDVERIIK
ncbi:MAG: hypothetical protein HQM10_04215 [Candidatus Riflebacteria bacterium]|nr:hypothetical protein [Candidatus Riflebacteria bacterium]